MKILIPTRTSIITRGVPHCQAEALGEGRWLQERVSPCLNEAGQAGARVLEEPQGTGEQLLVLKTASVELLPALDTLSVVLVVTELT